MKVSKKTEKLYNFKHSLKLSFCLEVFEPKMSEKHAYCATHHLDDLLTNQMTEILSENCRFLAEKKYFF